MENKYFGFITNEDFCKWDIERQEQHLIDLNLIEKGTTYSLKKHSIEELDIGEFSFKFSIPSTGKKEIKLKQDIKDELYSYISKRYERISKTLLFQFKNEFDRDTLGLLQSNKREYALEQFHIYLDHILPRNEFNEMHNQNDVPTNANTFYLLNKKKERLKNKIGQVLEIVIAFLNGQKNFFNRELLDTYDHISELIEFEQIMNILVTLNNEYEFEDDLYFNSDASTIKKLTHQFNNKIDHKTIKFIHNSIDKIEKNRPSEITALFFALKQLELLPITEKKFRETINETYNLELKTLKKSDSNIDATNDRIDSYIEKYNGNTNY